MGLPRLLTAPVAKSRSGGCRLSFEDDVVAEGFELSDEASDGAVGVLAAEVVAAGVVVELAVCEHVPDRGEDGVPDCSDGAIVSAAAAQTLILGGEVGVLGLAGGERGFGQGGSEPLVAFAGFPERRLPADSSFPGLIFAHDARCLGVAKMLMSTPISEIRTSAVR